MKFTSYYSARELLGYQALFNLVLSDRSDGKTFDCKVRALEDYDKFGYATVYMRRYSTEITANMYNTFFDEVLALDKYKYYADKYDFKYSKSGVQIALKDTKDYEFIVYFIPLSKSGKLKSQLDIRRIRMIDFDEYMPLDHRYLKDEMLLLAEFWKSVDRDRDTTQLLLLGNRIDPFCPFLCFFDIDLSIESKKLRTYRNGTLAVQVYVNQEHRDERVKSKFSVLMDNTAYSGYDLGGVLYGYQLNLTTLKPKAQPLYSFIVDGREGTIWLDDTVVFSDKKRKDLPVLVSDMRAAAADNREYLHCNNKADVFRTYFYTNRLALTNKNLEPYIMKLLRSR